MDNSRMYEYPVAGAIRRRFPHLTDEEFYALTHPPQKDPQLQETTAQLRAQPPVGYLSARQALHFQPGTDTSKPTEKLVYRIGYDPTDDAFYENGCIVPLARGWRHGCFHSQGITRKVEYDHNMVYLARDPRQPRNDPSRIEWHLHFYPGGYHIRSVQAVLRTRCFTPQARVDWLVRPLSTNDWQRVSVPNCLDNDPHPTIDLTPFVANQEYGFALAARLQGGDETGVSWQKTQLFRQSVAISCANQGTVENLPFEITAELQPDIVRHQVTPPSNDLGTSHDHGPGKLQLNDLDTSDFTIHVTAEDTITSRTFRCHRSILSTYSGYFQGLFHSQMSEAQNGEVNLKELDPDIFKRVLEYLYNHGQFAEKGTDQATQPPSHLQAWFQLLVVASRFDIRLLTEDCERALREYVTNTTLEEIDQVARTHHAPQLARYCELYPIYNQLMEQEEQVRATPVTSVREVPQAFLRGHSTDSDDLPGQTMRGPASMNR
ncbi:protein modification by small protein conjugation or removal [Dispira parvispora]|uniref:Protein modification by small protein conjugation or removal n=1 Tax=Dispira parvispora TaxID=1520584 RepID=A0A9W8E9K0_9FUNG|nr:protein modification by small protein conjugation or removal [Dispira parvispora]